MLIEKLLGSNSNLIPWILAGYVVIIIYTVIRILLDTHSSAKSLAYILLVIIAPVFGAVFYFAFGVNYRHSKSTKHRISEQRAITTQFDAVVKDNTAQLSKKHEQNIGHFSELVPFLYRLGGEYLSENKYTLLLNGEKKFPEVLRTLEAAEHSIHMEYYDWENDKRGNQIKDILLKKITQGVKVRIMFDDYASRNIKRNVVKELRKGGAEIHPVIKVKLAQMASRLNHRDHRKLIIVDGHTGFVGGINISDRYDNSIDTGLYWRDTHVKIEGNTVLNLQRHFVVNWNACQPNTLAVTDDLFPTSNEAIPGAEVAQVVAGGPIYPKSNIMLTYFKIFTSAREKLYITNPYFIPNESILDALKQAAISGVDVRLMVPEKSDSAIVGAASKFYFRELLEAGVKIFLYKKGFIHAKTVFADGTLSVVGTANMDIRSFDLNFEIFSIIYGPTFAKGLEQAFIDDLKESDEISLVEWKKTSTWKRLGYATARLISSFL